MSHDDSLGRNYIIRPSYIKTGNNIIAKAGRLPIDGGCMDGNKTNTISQMNPILNMCIVDAISNYA